ncbi:hypothetical protein AB0I66_11320 [Streptomyces sp. NPDC050439]|uniref:hypothetical protein n=1 Tax=unclassified Streptomyces TaxID=2593676 RepID=UPI00342107D7
MRQDVGVSHTLKKLKTAGLLTSERRATWVYYRAEPSVLAATGQLHPALRSLIPTSFPRGTRK